MRSFAAGSSAAGSIMRGPQGPIVAGYIVTESIFAESNVARSVVVDTIFPKSH